MKKMKTLSLWGLLLIGSLFVLAMTGVAVHSPEMATAFTWIPVIGVTDIIRRTRDKLFSSGEQNALQIATDAVNKKFMLKVTMKLSTPGGGAQGTTPLTEAPFSIIRSLYLDLDGKKRYTITGALLWFLERWKEKVEKLPTQTVTIPAAGNTADTVFYLPLNFGLPRSAQPSRGFIDFTRFTTAYLNIQMGAIANVLGTPNDTVVQSVQVELYQHEVMGLEKKENRWIEPQVVTIDLTATNPDKRIDLVRGDRDYIALILRAETAVDTPSHTPLSGKLEVKGSEPNRGPFAVREFQDITVLRDMNAEAMRSMASGEMTAGYAFIDFMSDGNYLGKLGTLAMTDFYLALGVTGAANNKVQVLSLCEIM